MLLKERRILVPLLRCDEVTRELAVPTGAVDAEVLARHVASCPSCAAWADASARLDRLWEETRPAEPGPEHWERVWSAVASEGAGKPRTLRLTPTAPAAGVGSAPRAPRRWLFPAIAAAFVAQAAAVAVLTWVVFRPHREAPTPATGISTVSAGTPAPMPSPQTVEFELEEGQTLFLVLDERAGKVICKPQFLATADLVAFDSESPDPYALAFQSDLDMLNAMESLE